MAVSVAGVGVGARRAAALPWRALRWVVLLPWRAITFPFRLSRQRISVQLILSHILVVLVTALVLEAAAILLVFGAARYFSANNVDTSLGYEAQSVAQTVQAGVPGGAMTPAAQAEIARQLQDATAPQLPSGGRGIGLAPDTSEAPVTRAFVVDPTGKIVASTDDTWAPVGGTFAAVAFRPAMVVTGRALELEGGRTSYGERYVLDVANGITAAAYPLTGPNGQFLGVVTVQGVPVKTGPSLEEWLAGLGLLNLVYLVGMAVVAFVVSTPVGIWRARVLSRRLSRLAAAADGMAQGDLSRRVVVTGEDEIARLAEHFNDMIERLEVTDRGRRSFVANISHELRTPVAILQGNLERLLTRQQPPDLAGVAARAQVAGAYAPPESPRDEAALRVMYQETMTLSRLIDDLFTLARLEETTLPLEIAPLPLDVVAAEAVASIKPLAWDERKVSVTSLVRPGLPAVLADATRLRQIFNNLLYNALRHTPEGGLIVVDAKRGDGMFEVTVTDTGIGIAPEELDSVFERFYRSERGRHQDGSGLGLHIVKQLVEAQGGTIAVESTLGQGTTFRFTLPHAPD